MPPNLSGLVDGYSFLSNLQLIFHKGTSIYLHSKIIGDYFIYYAQYGEKTCTTPHFFSQFLAYFPIILYLCTRSQAPVSAGSAGVTFVGKKEISVCCLFNNVRETWRWKEQDHGVTVDAHVCGHYYIYDLRFPPSTSERDVVQGVHFSFLYGCLAEIIVIRIIHDRPFILMMTHIIKQKRNNGSN